MDIVQRLTQKLVSLLVAGKLPDVGTKVIRTGTDIASVMTPAGEAKVM